MLADPALFTAPYDGALSEALRSASMEVQWVTRPLRPGELEPEGLGRRCELFYRGDAAASVKQGGVAAKFRKGLSHLLGAGRLLRHVRRHRPDVVHLQWSVFPMIDRWMISRLRAFAPVVFTVHDLTPFNASATSKLQSIGFESVLREASALIVHTEGAKQALLAQGFKGGKVVRIPHGPLRLTSAPPGPAPPYAGDRRWRIVLFGKLQPYKGVDILIEALGRLAPSVRAQLEVIVAGEPLMDIAPLEARIAQLGLMDVVRLQLGRLSDDQAHVLLDSADAFVFPYRAIEASGVLYLAANYGRWLIASDLGAFRDVIVPGVNGARVVSGDVEALASALQASVGRRPDPSGSEGLTSWSEIGARTRRLYESLIANEPRS